MAVAITKAQELITCDLNCDKPVQQFCNSCQVGLCEDCINKHVKSLKSMNHDIVPFTKRTVQMVYPQCTSHSHQRCEAYCQQCNIPVCITCLLGSHKGHDVEAIVDIIVQKRENIKRETEEIEIIINKNKKQDEDTEKKISIATVHYSELEKKSTGNRKEWHTEVDNVFDKLDSLIQLLRDQEITNLKSCQSQLKNLNSKMTETVKGNKAILKVNEMSNFNNYQSKLIEFRNTPQVPDLILPPLETNTIQGKELGVELGEYKAKLIQKKSSGPTDEAPFQTITELLKQAKLIANIPANVKPLYRVACVGSDRAWISGKDKMIRCVNMHGTVQDTAISTCVDFPTDIAVNIEGELIYSDSAHRTVNIIRHGGTDILITTPRGWHPKGLCCTRSGDILVSVASTNNSHYKIVRYQGEAVKQEIDKDEHGNAIYHGGDFLVFVTENKNGDIVVSDINDRAVVVVDRAGKVRFRYNKRPPGGQQPFCPEQLVTDSVGRIIVVDQLNHCLHILDQHGHLLRCVNNHILYKPFGLSVDSMIPVK